MGSLFGITILASIMISCCGIRVPIVRPTLWSAGLLCGLMGTISGVGGPPMILLYQNEPGPVVRGNLGVIFVFASLFSIAALTLSGHFGTHEAILGAIISGWAVYFKAVEQNKSTTFQGLPPAALRGPCRGLNF